MALSIEMVESNDSHTATVSGSPAGSSIHVPSWEYYLRKYLMLLAGLVATATYEASFSTPGVSPPEESEGGSMVLKLTPQYITFVYFNTTAFAASIGVNLLLLVLNEKRPVWLAVLRFVMVLDLLALMGAYASGSCFDVPSTVYTWLLVVALAAYVGVHILLASYTPLESEVELGLPEEQSPEESLKLTEQRKVLMLLATFAVGISYSAGLNLPGGGGGEEVRGRQPLHRMAFFYCNTTAFVASLLIIVLLLVRRLQSRCCAMVQLCGLILVVLFGLVGAYVSGSYGDDAGSSAYVIALVDLVLVYIFLVMTVLVVVSNPLKNTRWLPHQFVCAYSACSSWLQKTGFGEGQLQADGGRQRHRHGSNMVMVDEAANNTCNNKPAGMEKVKSLLLLLATLVATITYHAGLDPPGGVRSRDGQQQNSSNSYKAGDPILSLTNPGRYMVFYYCNSTAFVASLVVILMVRARGLIRRHTLEVAMLLCLLGLIGAYAAGSCRDVITTVKLIALPAATLAYVVIHVVFFTLDHKEMGYEDNRKLEKRRKRLLLLAILVATITYQAGLTPPGGFWTEDLGEWRRAGGPIMADTYGMRYQAFFYCNSTSFMVSITLIILLVNPNLYKPGIRCYALYVCMVIALFGLMGAYLSGTIPDPRTSMYVFVLVAVVITLIAITAMVLVILFIFGEANGGEDSSSSRPSPAGGTAMRRQRHNSGSNNSARRKYMMVLAILAASVTYQAAMKPPGGGDHAGNAVMRRSNPARYSAFFYCNSTSFVASVVVIVLLLQESLQNNVLLLYAMNTAIVLDLLGLLGAYAVGSSREWKATGYVVALLAAVLAYIAIHLVLWLLGRRARDKVNNTPATGPVLL
uniref:PGG domain-containing protein n=1 Tax=Hordeum vulgare subsp. vulgare TaxID=112509 RepID=A0A8I6WXK3_HORVV